MKPIILIAVAGIPSEIERKFIVELNRKIECIDIVACQPLDRAGRYAQEYSEKLYQRFARNLKKRGGENDSVESTKANVVLLYLNKGDSAEICLLEKFGVEALALALVGTEISKMKLDTESQRRKAINELSKEAKRTIDGARILLSVIAEEVINRDNRTCLLLPPKNYGSKIEVVFSCVQDAVVEKMKEEEFRNRIRQIANYLPKRRKRGRDFFIGDRGLVFESPGKSGPRHGRAPDWKDGDHNYSCIIRGKFRFGVAYDSKFHYDCALSKGSKRILPSCHGEKTIAQNRAHANIAPNDNIR